MSTYPNQDQFQAVWEVEERLGDVLSIGRTACRDVAPGNKPPFSPCHHLEDEDMGEEHWFTAI